MEESKAAAYYDELTRKGEGAARFKRGLGFSASDSDEVSTSKGSALPTPSSFLSSFVKASSPSKTSEFEKQAQLEAIQNKLKKRQPSSFEEEERRSRVPERDYQRSSNRRRSLSRDREGQQRSRRRSLSRDGERQSRRRSRSRDRYGDMYRDRGRERRRSRSRGDSGRDRRRRRSRSSSSRERWGSRKNGSSGAEEEKSRKVERQNTERVDYSRLIEGYNKMSPAERVKAKTKLQLAETAKMDDTRGSGSGWERFEFNKDAPLDDEEIEAAEDDATLVKRIGQSFRFSAVEARKEEQIKAAHDQAMFGAPIGQLSSTTDSEVEEESGKVESCKSGLAASILSEKVLAKQQGSWRDRARKV